MLSDPKAVEIIGRARQKNVAQSNRSDRDFVAIFRDFFNDHDFQGERVLDLGPGQYDFARRVRDLGGRVDNVDRDEAVLELGAYLGFETIEADLRTFDLPERTGTYDGLFCKFSINAFWFDTPEALRTRIRALDALLRPGGWGWIAPWNGLPKRGIETRDVHAMLQAQVDAFGECGWRGYELTERLCNRYGIGGAVANHPLFLKGLPESSAVARLAVLKPRRGAAEPGPGANS